MLACARYTTLRGALTAAAVRHATRSGGGGSSGASHSGRTAPCAAAEPPLWARRDRQRHPSVAHRTRSQVRTMAKRSGKKNMRGDGGMAHTGIPSGDQLDAAGGDGAAAAAAAAAGGARLQLLERVVVTTEVKKSKFVATATPVSSPAEAMRFVAENSDLGASHNCFAYKARRGPDRDPQALAYAMKESLSAKTQNPKVPNL